MLFLIAKLGWLIFRAARSWQPFVYLLRSDFSVWAIIRWLITSHQTPLIKMVSLLLPLCLRCRGVSGRSAAGLISARSRRDKLMRRKRREAGRQLFVHVIPTDWAPNRCRLMWIHNESRGMCEKRFVWFLAAERHCHAIFACHTYMGVIELTIMRRGVSELMFWLSLQSRADTLWNVARETLQTIISIQWAEELFCFLRNCCSSSPIN